MNRRKTDGVTILELTVGTLHKELAKAREQLVLCALEDNYGYLEWRVRSDNPNYMELYGKRNQHEDFAKLGSVQYAGDFRSDRPLDATVEFSYKGSKAGGGTGKA